MATQRYVSTSFWDDEWIQTLDPSEKLLYLYLLTNPLTNIAGVYKITERRISFDTGFNLDTIRHIFTKFEKAGKAYKKDEYVVLPSWPKHQKWDKSTKVKEGIDRILKELEPEIIMFLNQIGYRYPIDTLSIPYTYPPNYSYSYSNLDLNLDLKRERDAHTKTNHKKFVKPTIEQVSTYCLERKNTINPQQFVDYYESKGWLIGKSPMKDWKAAVRTWEHNGIPKGFDRQHKISVIDQQSNDRFAGMESGDTTKEMLG